MACNARDVVELAVQMAVQDAGLRSWQPLPGVAFVRRVAARLLPAFGVVALPIAMPRVNTSRTGRGIARFTVAGERARSGCRPHRAGGAVAEAP